MPGCPDLDEKVQSGDAPAREGMNWQEQMQARVHATHHTLLLTDASMCACCGQRLGVDK